MAETANSRDTLHREGKSAEAFRTISEVANKLDVPPHVLRFWETKFSQVKPLKRGGGRRYYRPEDVHLLRAIRELLYTDGYTIKGVQKLLREGGAKAVVGARDADVGKSAAGDPPNLAVAAPEKASESPTGDNNKNNKINDIISDLENLRDILRQG